MRYLLRALVVLGFLIIPSQGGMADEKIAADQQLCDATDIDCLFGMLGQSTAAISNQSWKDSTYRETAKLLAALGRTDDAIAVLDDIEGPDKKAMTIRGIGVAAADLDLTAEEYETLFTNLRAEAEKIDHPPSYAIAMNYIADAQALAGDDKGAMKTAMDLDNAEMRNKALYDCAKIQSEKNKPDTAMASIAAIDNAGFRDKGYRDISKIFADNAHYESALKTASPVENPYQKAQAVLYILVKQITPEEVSVE